MSRLSFMVKMKLTPKFSTRQKNRCPICGRPRAYMRQFKMCRICFRNMANEGLIPGVTKSSW